MHNRHTMRALYTTPFTGAVYKQAQFYTSKDVSQLYASNDGGAGDLDSVWRSRRVEFVRPS